MRCALHLYENHDACYKQLLTGTTGIKLLTK